MGTRSTYRIIQHYRDYDTKRPTNRTLVLVYMQYDGYPTGHPLKTAEWLASGKVVNGIPISSGALMFNGAGCLAAQFIARNKSGAGGTYLHPFEDRGNYGEDYMYDIIVDEENKDITMVAYDYDDKKIFEGKPEEFVAKYQK